MLSDHIPPLWKLVPLELKQCSLEGLDIAAFSAQATRLGDPDLSEAEKDRLAAELFDGLIGVPIVADYPYLEPVDLQGILDARPVHGKGLVLDTSGLSDKELYDHIYGAWLGRCAGCLLGQPVEFWPRERLTGLLRESDNYPIRRYISSDIPAHIRDKYGVSDQGWSYGCNVTNWINNVEHMPEDDDINYTVLALKLLEQSGAGFTSDDVALRWLMDLPALHTFTAERVAYRNLLNGMFPPRSARYRNPCREWIGAQIRGDFFGYVNPGRPEDAIRMAYRDASVSHMKNGVYGEMFVAAMLASALAGISAEGILRCGLSQLPEHCRLSGAVRQALEWKQAGVDWQSSVDNLHGQYNEKEPFDSLYAVPNAMVVSIGLLYGELDFTKSMGIALAGSFDKDCNCATLGSIIGMALGAKALPDQWIAPLNDGLRSGIDGFGLTRISDLASRTLGIIRKFRNGKDQA